VKIITKEIRVKTQGKTDIIDITDKVAMEVGKSGLVDGSAALFVRGSTGSLTTIEYEPNLVKDFKDALERIAPSTIRYAHSETWGDFNGHSHVRASLMGPSLQVPFIGGELQLGTWQQVVFVEFDTKPRDRKILLQMIGS